MEPGQNCSYCPLGSTVWTKCRMTEPMTDESRGVPRPGPKCPHALLAAKKRECDGLLEAARELMLLFASGNSIPVDRVVLKPDHRIVNMFHAALAEGGE